MSTRREFLKQSGAAGLGAAAMGTTMKLANAQSTGSSSSGGSAAMLVSNPQHVAPATVDRLPLEWHQDRVKILQEKLAELGIDGILITDRWNIIYFTGLFHTTTERPFACFIPTNELAVHWYYPAGSGTGVISLSELECIQAKTSALRFVTWLGDSWRRFGKSLRFSRRQRLTLDKISHFIKCYSR